MMVKRGISRLRQIVPGRCDRVSPALD